MAGITDLANVWNNIKEIDLRPIRDEALQWVKIAIVGASDAERQELAEQMRRDPVRPAIQVRTPLLLLDLKDAAQTSDADLIVLILNTSSTDYNREKALARAWADAGKRVLVFINQDGTPGDPQVLRAWINWGQRRIVYGVLSDQRFLQSEFAEAVIALLPKQTLALARAFPLFRMQVAYELINDTCFSNAAYSLSTGLAEIVPVFDIPLNVTDMIVLTKSQAFLIYKLGLALGYSTRWQSYVAEFGSVLGGGFLWRQLARGLVGLIPVWGIVPKVAVAYSGTFVVGNVILQWYRTGRHISGQQMQQLYLQAFSRGKQVAQALLARLHWRRKKPRKEKILLPAQTPHTCASCGRTSSPDATFCQYCGQPLDGLIVEK